MPVNSLLVWATLVVPGGHGVSPAPKAEPVRVVTSLTTYGAIAKVIVGDKGTVTSIAQGDENPHFVQPKPSFVALLRRADLFVTTGMDLELWVPGLLDRAGNRNVMPGSPGYVSASSGLELMEVPVSVDRSAGDIHIYGNPHIHTDPLNAILIARNIQAGLERVDPENADYFAARAESFERRVLEALMGPELVEILTPSTALQLLSSGQLLDFLATTQYQGRPLAQRLGGWLERGEVLRGREMVCYHKEWSYFSRRFGISCAEFVESKPGIPPTPRHVRDLIDLMRRKKIPAIFGATYSNQNQMERVAERTGAQPVVLPENTGGAPGVVTYFDLVDGWIDGLVAAYSKTE